VRSSKVSSVSSSGPDVWMRLSLSSMRALILVTELHLEKMLTGSNDASPYLAFFCNRRSSSLLHFALILLLVFI